MISFDDLYGKLEIALRLAEQYPETNRDFVLRLFLDKIHEECANSNISKDRTLSIDKAEDIKAFLKKMNPQSNIERTLVFTYYLEEKLHMNAIRAEDIAKCYELAEFADKPKNLQQNIHDCSSKRYGYIRAVQHNIYQTTEVGKAFCREIEHSIKE